MDSLLVNEIDDLLRMKLPKKSCMSGAQLIWAPPENTQTLDLIMSNVIRLRLPKFNGFLARAKGGTGCFMVVTIGADQRYVCEVYAFIRQLRILLNATEIHNNQRFDKTYSSWLKKKPLQWLNYDGSQLGIPSNFGPMTNKTNAISSNGKFYGTFLIPFPDNYSILTNKDHAFPLQNTDVYIEFYLNNANNFMTGVDANGDATNLTGAQVSGFGMYLPIASVDPDVSNAINAKLKMGDESDEEMFLMAIQDISASQQTYDFGSAGNKTFIWNNVSSMCRFLEAELTTEPTGNVGYKIGTALNPKVYQYQFVIDGKNVGAQNPVLVPNDLHPLSYNMAFAVYQDLVSSYNQVNNNTQDWASFDVNYFLGPTALLAGADREVITYPAIDEAINSNFVMCCNLDTVSKDDLLGGVKLFNNLALNIDYGGNPAGDGTYTSLPCTCVLLQHSNRLIAFSETKCKLVK